MRKVVFACDDCQKDLDGKRHLSLQMGNDTGVAESKRPYWIKKMGNCFLHFCNGQCAGRFFSRFYNEWKN